MPIKVIGAGLGRTGTLSLKTALEELGFGRCYHMVDVLARWTTPGPGTRPRAASPSDWDRLFDGYQATVDWPGCSFYRELMQKYPEAKVILTVPRPRALV